MEVSLAPISKNVKITMTSSSSSTSSAEEGEGEGSGNGDEAVDLGGLALGTVCLE
jgi:hypothetical protein